jgi:hypothetical protein
MAQYNGGELALGVKVAVRHGPRECIGVVTRFDGKDVIVRLTQTEWNEPPELRARRDEVRCLPGWV